MIIVTGNRAEALARLDVFVGEWVVQAGFPAGRLAPSGAAGEGPQARSRLEWALDRQFLLQRTQIPVPEAPDSLAIISADGNIISGAWEIAHDAGWEHDFALTYHRVS